MPTTAAPRVALPPASLSSGLPSPLFDFAAAKRTSAPALAPAVPPPPVAAPAVQTPSAGPMWFDMQAPVLTPEVQRDLRVLRLRSYANPKHFFKTDDYVSKDRKHRLPSVFQLGTVIAGAGETPKPRRERKANIALEVLADEETRRYAAHVFKSVQDKKKSGGKNAYKRKMNKRSRFDKKKVIG